MKKSTVLQRVLSEWLLRHNIEIFVFKYHKTNIYVIKFTYKQNFILMWVLKTIKNKYTSIRVGLVNN